MTELMFNIEILLNTPATAVRCSTEEEAQQFLNYMKAHYPELCENWDADETRFDYYDDNDGIAYTFYWNRGGEDWVKDSMMFGSVHSIIEDGYDVLELYELMETKELVESDQSVESLFGGLI